MFVGVIEGALDVLHIGILFSVALLCDNKKSIKQQGGGQRG